MDDTPRSPDSRPMADAWWPIILAVAATAALRLTLPSRLRVSGSPWLVVGAFAIIMIVLVVGDPGRIDRRATWLRVLTTVLIGLITVVNGASAVRLVVDIVNVSGFTNEPKKLLAAGGAIWATNVIAFALWYWDLDRGGAASRANGEGESAFVFPEMDNPERVPANWSPRFVDYFHLSFTTATAFSPTDVSAIRPWAKLMMMTEEAISLVIAILVVARAVNILR
jgi:hypothetical protein